MFIELTDQETKKPMLVSASDVVAILVDMNDNTVLMFRDDSIGDIVVVESMEQVAAMLGVYDAHGKGA